MHLVAGLDGPCLVAICSSIHKLTFCLVWGQHGVGPNPSEHRGGYVPCSLFLQCRLSLTGSLLANFIVACLRGVSFLSCRCPVTTGVVVLSLPIYCCCTVVYCCLILSCLVTISINVLYMCFCLFAANFCRCFVG